MSNVTPFKGRQRRERNVSVEEALSDSVLASTVARDVLAGRWCWVPGLGWFAWDGKRWGERDAASVTEAVRLHLLHLFARAVRDDPRLTEDYLPVLMARKIRPVVDLSRGIVLVEPSALDAHPDLLNTQTGIVDLRTGELRPHDPALMMTRITATGYVPGARHDDWDAALTALPDDVRDWYQVRLGQGITGYMTPDDLLLVSQGGGQNGKTTVHSTVQHVLGGYSTLLPHRVLLAAPGDHPTELMELRGSRLAVMEETPEARRLSVQRLKTTVGTPQITARRIRQDSVTFDATHTMLVATNYRPVVEETDNGTWRRLALVVWPYTYRPAGVPLRGDRDRAGDPTLRDRLARGREQQEAALAWLIDGARRWYAADRAMPATPDRVTTDTRTWRAESDLVMGYMDEHLVVDGTAHVHAAELAAHFGEWLDQGGHKPWSARTFHARFGGHDDVIAAGIERRAKIRPQRDTIGRPLGLSRPAGSTAGDPGATYAAWLGVRFKTSAEQVADAVDMPANQDTAPPNQDHVPSVPSSFGEQPSRIHEPSSHGDGTDGTGAGDAAEPDARPAPDGVLPERAGAGAVTGPGWYCVRCDEVVAAEHWGECAGHAGRCGQRVHRYGQDGHGPLCRDCRPGA